MTDTPLSARDLDRLRHIAEASERALRYTSEGRASLDDERTYDAVLRCLTVIGEALAAVSDEAYRRLPSVPPGLPKAQRNLIVHEYWRIKPEVIWATVQQQLPSLIHDVKTALNE
ncbi:HepT-like ribonuclease domain-containing protein [Demequina aurantiaca]|uniref:HepT-like ribonuclease domain-containing protein n=1 Tax=Demequina aurantiaca TaxID=676200 RepID=UPI003D3575B9